MNNKKFVYAVLETDELYDDTLVIAYFDDYNKAQEKANELNNKSRKYKYDFYYSVVYTRLD